MKLQLKFAKFIGELILICATITSQVAGQGINFNDFGNSAVNIIQGLSSQGIQEIPTPDKIFSTSIQVLFGFPEQVIFTAINQACSLFLASGAINPRVTSSVEKMHFQLRTPCKNISVPLQQPEELVNLEEFDIEKKVVILVSGWGSDGNKSTYIQDFADAFNCRGEHNFVYLNTGDSIQTLYSWSAFNTDEIGNILAESLQRLTQSIPMENIHLIGHSLGAQIVGKAGQQYKELTGQSLPRITGLDPANPCFNEGEELSGISRGDATFVDIIHSNPGVLGKSQSLGDVDFYPNGKQAIQPGCVNFGCSHERSMRYFIETVYPVNEQNFVANRCNSLDGIDNGRCNGPEHVMGYAVPHDIEGNYYLNVNGDQPYGQNAPAEAIVQPNQCGKCENIELPVDVN